MDKRHGGPWLKPDGTKPTIEDRFWDKVDKNGPIPKHRPELGPCWLWMGSKQPSGYGIMKINSKKVRVHRLAWQLTHGSIPDGLWVLHHCDNPLCVNHNHLFLGDHLDNIKDKVAKNRQAKGAELTAKARLHNIRWGDDNPARKYPERMARGKRHGLYLHPEKRPRGEKHGRARLTAEQVAEIRTQYATGKVYQKDLARRYGVSQSQISHIICDKAWRTTHDA